jgi:hypothetical protein
MKSENYQDIDFKNEVDDSFNNTKIVEDFDSPEEIEFQRKLDNPFHLFQKGDYWLKNELFCLNCGNKTHPFIIDKLIIERKEKARTTFTKDHLGRRVPLKSVIGLLFKYCEILRCGHESCGDLFFRTYIIFEDKNEPEDEPQTIPIRKDKAPIKNESEDSEFIKAYNRYAEAIMAYNMGLNFASGASIRSVLEILCKIRGHFQNILNMRTYGKNLQKQQLEKEKRKIGLEEQVKIFVQEIQAIAPESLTTSDVEKIKLMMYWGHGIVHGSIDPNDDELKAGFDIVEELFRVLYFDPIDSERQRTYQEQREQNKQHRKEQYQESGKRFDKYGQG